MWVEKCSYVDFVASHVKATTLRGLQILYIWNMEPLTTHQISIEHTNLPNQHVPVLKSRDATTRQRQVPDIACILKLLFTNILVARMDARHVLRPSHVVPMGQIRKIAAAYAPGSPETIPPLPNSYKTAN